MNQIEASTGELPSGDQEAADSLSLRNQQFARRVLPFLQAGVLDHGAIHVVDLLAQDVRIEDPEVMLGLALAVRAPGEGHVGVDLLRIARTLIVEEAGDDPDLHARIAGLRWPEDPGAWHDQVVDSALVEVQRGHARGNLRAPFVEQGHLLMTHRCWDYQQRLYEALTGRAEAATPGVRDTLGQSGPLDIAALRDSLARLFPGALPDDRQRLGALAAALRGFTIISGGPGTGKTFTVKKVLAVLRDQWQAAGLGAPRVALAAPTGKAAARMGEAICAELDKLPLDEATCAWLRSLEPRTLHRLLGFQPRTPTRFRHDRDNPLQADVVVVDEASMVDLAMMCKLLDAVPPHARLILLGDRNQLASVEAGSVLADITHGVRARGVRYSPTHMGRLAEVLGDAIPEQLRDAQAPPLADSIVQFVKPFRSSENSGIQAVAYAIAGQDLPSAEAWLTGHAAKGRGPFEDLVWHDHEGVGLAPRALEVMLKAYAGPDSYLAALGRGPRPGEPREAFLLRVLRLLERVRVLAAHRRGRLGVAGLNAAIQSALAEARDGCVQVGTRGTRWHGRPILVTENNYDVDLRNGDVGMLVREGGDDIAVFAGSAPGEIKERALAQLPQHETVFAMTVHKSQGSEFDHTILVLPCRRSAILTRELVYTALTRAKARITLCGSPKVLDEGLRRTVTRASSLDAMLWAADDSPREGG